MEVLARFSENIQRKKEKQKNNTKKLGARKKTHKIGLFYFCDDDGP